MKKLPSVGKNITISRDEVTYGKRFPITVQRSEMEFLLETLKRFTLGLNGDESFQRVPTSGRVNLLKSLYAKGAFVPPITVAEVEDGTRIVVDGGTRLRAALAVEVDEIDMLVYKVKSVAEAAKLFAIYNNGSKPNEDGLVYSASGNFAEKIRSLNSDPTAVLHDQIGNGSRRKAIGALRLAQIVSNFHAGACEPSDPANPLRLVWHRHLSNCDAAFKARREDTLAVLDFVGEWIRKNVKGAVVHNWTAHALGILLHEDGVPTGKRREAILTRLAFVAQPAERIGGKITVSVEERILRAINQSRPYRWAVVPALVKYLRGKQ